ncbi:MAG: hypothetical protein COB02_13135 [Candidatus Cloacimonadota bacterium]|nr:MAG: hypothetical protein COB02_13135 [Candidatus Cloacimonadota bacterium]
MKIFEINSDCDKYEGMVDEAYVKSNYDDDYIQDFDDDMFLSNTPIVKNWIGVNLLPVADKYKGKKSDFPNFYSSAPLFSLKSKNILLPHLTKLGVFYEFIVSEKEKYYCFKVTNLLDGFLNHQNSIFKRFSSSNRIMSIEKFIFKNELRSTFIFRIPERKSPIFCNERLKEIIEQHKLKGFVFSEIGEYKIKN